MQRIMILVMLIIPLRQQAQESTTYSPAELAEDLHALKAGIETYNPGLDVFHSGEEFKQVYDSLYSAINSPMTDLEFYPFLVRLGAAVKEGHMMIGTNADTLTNIFKGFYNGQFRYFPLSLFADSKDDIRITGNFSANDSILQGDILREINGQDIATVLNELDKFQIVDGDIQRVRRKKSVDNFGSGYFWFIDQPDTFHLQLLRENRIVNTAVTSLSRDSMIVWRNDRYGKPERDPVTIQNIYEYEINDDYALLKLKTFNRQLMERFKVKPKKLYDEIFKELEEKNIRHLVMDLRNNPGGRKEYAEELLPYIMKEQLKGLRYTATSWKGKVKKYKFPKRDKDAFDGELYVLINGNSFSNGSVIPMMAKEYGNAIIIGSESASRYEGFVAGSRQAVILPNTGLKCFIPRYVYTYPGELHGQKPQNHGVIPDYPITYSWQDWLDRNDLEMEKALQLIRSKSVLPTN